MIKLSPQLTAMLSGLWAVAIGATTQIPSMPWWGHYVIVAAGVLAAGLGINTSTPPPTKAELEEPWT